MSIMEAVGAYTHKEPMSALIHKFKIPFAMMALVHERGTMKYVSYSWIQSPKKSNSTVEANLDAIDRHLGAHSMGKLIDVEGLPHLFHLACRAGMLVTTFLRESEPAHKTTPIRKADSSLSDVACQYPGSQITSEELLACSRELPAVYSPIESASPEEIYPVLRALLMECHLFPQTHSSSPLSLDTKNIMQIEVLFRLIMSYVSAVWEKDKKRYAALLQENYLICPLRDKDYEFMRVYLGIDIDRTNNNQV